MTTSPQAGCATSQNRVVIDIPTSLVEITIGLEPTLVQCAQRVAKLVSQDLEVLAQRLIIQREAGGVLHHAQGLACTVDVGIEHPGDGGHSPIVRRGGCTTTGMHATEHGETPHRSR